MLKNAANVSDVRSHVVAKAARPAAIDCAGMLRVLTCGSVDDGKSTLIGRLLWDAGDLPEDTRETINRSVDADGIPDVSLLLDGLEAERSQGITIDIAWRYVYLDARRFVFIDCPGHEQYTRNMATGASQADVAIMLVDARQGIKPQTKRHAAILQLVGIRNVILVVNKMDLVGWSEAVFGSIAAQFDVLAVNNGFNHAVAIPIAARHGDNVARLSEQMPWFSGPTLLTALKEPRAAVGASEAPFRFPVQTVLRDGKDFRGLAGTVASGEIKLGDEIIEALSGRRAIVKRISTFDGDRLKANAGAAVAIELTTDLDIARGGMLSSVQRPATVGRDIEARVVWLADDAPGKIGLLLRTGTDLVPVASLAVTSILDLTTKQPLKAHTCGPNDIANTRIELGRGVALDRFEENKETGHLILVDALSGATVAGGVVTSINNSSQANTSSRFRLSRALLAATVCADLPRSPRPDAEFKRRAAEVAFLLSAAGVKVDLESFDDDNYQSEGSGI